MAELTVFDLCEMNEEMELKWLNEMDSASRVRADEMANPLRRRQRIAGDHLTREAAARLTGRSLRDVEILRTPSGKPFTEGCCFSVSHSGTLVVCAAGMQPVGVDAEQIRPYDARIPNRFFTPEEQALLADAPDKDRCFWQIWTGKEALVKLSGEGIAGIKRADICTLRENVHLTWQCVGEHIVAIAEQTE